MQPLKYTNYTNWYSNSCYANNLNDAFTQKSMLKIEAHLSALKSFLDCERSILTSKIDAFSDSLNTH